MISPLSSCVLFQFTPLREGRHKGAIKDGDKLIISIHAPPRGATAPCRGRSMFFSFQFTPLREGRPCGMSSVRAVIHFNSRPSARGDQARCWAYQPPVNFNSRPSARGDGKRYAISANLLFNPYKSAWLNNSATQFVEIILVIFHRIIV